jgi:hypothetical protein
MPAPRATADKGKQAGVLVLGRDPDVADRHALLPEATGTLKFREVSFER